MNSPIFDPLRLRYAVLGIGLALLLSGLGAVALALGSNETQAVAGHEYTVDSTDDADGDCPLPPAPPTGHCTLRTAIVLANADSDIDLIRFSPELSLPATIKLNSPLTIKRGVTITGPTSGVVTLDGQDDTRHFTIETPASPVFSPVSISNLTLVDGYSQLGGAIAFSDYGGGSDQELSLRSVTIRDSEAFHELYAENSGFGGAIYAVAERSYYAPRAKLTVSLDDVKLVGNLAACAGGAIFANVTTLHIQRSWFEANHNQNSYNCYYQYSGDYESDGGAIRILSKTSAEVTASTFYTNTSKFDGGAVSNSGSLSIDGSTLRENGSYGGGGGISNTGILTIINSTLDANRAQRGGAIANDGSLNVSRSSFETNRSLAICPGGEFLSYPCGKGGAIVNRGSLGISESTFSANASNDEGGAIYNRLEGGEPSMSATVSIKNSTLSGNRAVRGGGIVNVSNSPSYAATVTINHSTITQNEANSGGGLFNARAYDYGTAVLRIANSIVAGNVSSGSATSDDCHNSFGAQFTSQGYNLTGEGSSSGCSFDHTGDRTVNPDDIFTEVLAPKLIDNGGPTQTHFLLPGSPAINHIPYDANGCGTAVTTDQRGVPRPVQDNCDIGSYETIPMTVGMSVTAVGTEQAVIRTVTATVTYLGDPNRPVDRQLVGFKVTEGTVWTPKYDTTNIKGQAVFYYPSVAPQSQHASVEEGTLGQPLTAPEAPSDMDYIWVWTEQNGNYDIDWFEPYRLVKLPTAITLVSFTAQPNADGTVTLEWTTAAEIDNAGFNLHRAATRDGPYIKINDQLIPGQGLGLQMGASYSYLDRPPSSGVYFYKLEDVDYNGVGTFHDEVLPATVSGNPYRLYLPMFGAEGEPPAASGGPAEREGEPCSGFLAVRRSGGSLWSSCERMAFARTPTFAASSRGLQAGRGPIWC